MNLPPDIIRDPVPHPARAAVAILKTGVAKGQKAIVPAIKGGLRNAQLVQSGPDAQVGLLDQADGSPSFSDAGYLIPRLPHARACFY